MGNALRSLYGKCCQPEDDYSGVLHLQSGTVSTVGVFALARDINGYESTHQVPQELDTYVVSSRKAQINWYRKLSEAWRETNPPPQTPEEASRLVVLTLQRHQKADVEGLLAYYGLPLPRSLVDLTDGAPPLEGQELMFELHTLPVDARDVADGDGMTVYVSTSDPRESSLVPRQVLIAATKRAKARANRNNAKANEFEEQIKNEGYSVITIQDEDVLARKYRIRLRGIDAPENAMPFGLEAKEELTKIIRDRCLKIQVFRIDPYERCVGDVYCNGIFVQEVLVKKGMAWHFKKYDKRPELIKWAKEARAKGLGLWSLPNPEMPWEWRKKNMRRGRR